MEPRSHFSNSVLKLLTEMSINDSEAEDNELRNMWNSHLERSNFTRARHLKLANITFLEEHCAAIISKNLYRSYVRHLCSMYDRDFISSHFFYQLLTKMQAMVLDNRNRRLGSVPTIGLQPTLELPTNESSAIEKEDIGSDDKKGRNSKSASEEPTAELSQSGKGIDSENDGAAAGTSKPTKSTGAIPKTKTAMVPKKGKGRNKRNF